MKSIRRVLVLVSVVTSGFMSGNLHAFNEGWEVTPLGTYVPTPEGSLPRLIPADEGDWMLADTVTEFPDCGPTPHTAEVFAGSNGRLLRLTSGNSNSSCADNVSIDLSEVPQLSLNPGFSIPITAETIISFDESGSLIDPQPGTHGCIGPPCGDAVTLYVVDNNRNILAYVLQRAPQMVPDERNSAYQEIFLDPDATRYTRNLFDDLSTIPNFSPSGASIVAISFQIDEHGSADIDNLCIGGGECGSISAPTVDLSGTVKTNNGQDICAMILASGQYTFSCNPPGGYSLTGLPLEKDGTVKRQIYADGFFPQVDVLAGSSNEAVVMMRSGACPNYNTPYDTAVLPGSAGKRINISGKVLLQSSQTAICAMVLANGQYMFSCDGTGSYALNIPLDSNGQFKLQVYADGFAPITQTFDEFQAINDVRMARSAECQ
jgi:hypothetical protein